MCPNTRKDVAVIFQAWKLVLYKERKKVKKKGGCFDVTMGVYDRAKVCELVGIYMLY